MRFERVPPNLRVEQLAKPVAVKKPEEYLIPQSTQCALCALLAWLDHRSATITIGVLQAKGVVIKTPYKVILADPSGNKTLFNESIEANGTDASGG